MADQLVDTWGQKGEGNKGGRKGEKGGRKGEKGKGKGPCRAHRKGYDSLAKSDHSTDLLQKYSGF